MSDICQSIIDWFLSRSYERDNPINIPQKLLHIYGCVGLPKHNRGFKGQGWIFVVNAMNFGLTKVASIGWESLLCTCQKELPRRNQKLIHHIYPLSSLCSFPPLWSDHHIRKDTRMPDVRLRWRWMGEWSLPLKWLFIWCHGWLRIVEPPSEEGRDNNWIL